MSKSLKILSVAACLAALIAGAWLYYIAGPRHARVTNQGVSGTLHTQTGAQRSKHSSTSTPGGVSATGVRIEATGRGTVRIEQRVNVQTGKHGRDASANASSNVRAVAPSD